MESLNLPKQTIIIMSSAQLKEKLHQYIDQADDRLLNLIHAMLEADINTENRISIEQYNKELDEAEARIDAGEYYTQQEVEEMAKKW